MSSSRRDLVMLPARRLLAVDAGSSALKLLLVEEMFGSLRVLRREVWEVRAGSELSEDEALRQAQAQVLALGDSPAALSLPQYRSLSEVMDLASADPADVRAAIREETSKLVGLGDSQLVHDYSPLTAFGRFTHPFWVTLCQEAEIQHQIVRCGLSQSDLCEVTTGGNSLIAAFESLDRATPQAVLVDIGAAGTTVALWIDGQAVHASSFPRGGDSFTETIAAARKCSLDEAERVKASLDLERRDDAAAVEPALQAWNQELLRVLAEWRHQHPGLLAESKELECWLAGGGSLLAGLPEFLNRSQSLQFRAWPAGGEDAPDARFAIAWGAVLHALGKARQPASLLPDEVRVYWNRHHSLQVLHSLLFFLLAILTLLLGFATWQKVDLFREKQALFDQSASALVRAQLTETLSRRLVRDYEALRPVLDRRRETVDFLQALALLQQIRSNRTHWYVLFADEESYFTAPPYGATNPVVVTNLTWPVSLPPHEGFIAELCVPEQGETRRRALSDIVERLRQSALFRNADSLADDRRRGLVDPQVVIPDSHFALELDRHEDPWSRPGAAGRRPAGGAEDTGMEEPTARPSRKSPGPTTNGAG